jgi:hypothetical protein
MSEKRTAEQQSIDRLHAVAAAAKALVMTAKDEALFTHQATVDERALTTLETALAAAGYDLTDEEVEQLVGEL